MNIITLWHRGVKQINRLLELIARPVKKSPRFFAMMSLLGMTTPLAFIAMTRAHIFTITIFICLQSIVEAYLICTLLSLLRPYRLKKVVKISLFVLWALIAGLEIGSIAMTGEPITTDSAALILETTFSESSGFLMQYFRWSTLIALLAYCAVLIAVYVLLPRLMHRMCSPRINNIIATSLLPILLLCGIERLAEECRIVSIQSFDELIQWVSQSPDGNTNLMRIVQLRFADPILKWAYIYKDHSLQSAEISVWERTQQEAMSTKCEGNSANNFNIVMIIGESMIRNHSSLYGYYLPTNPRLSAERDKKNLVVFTNIFTTANYTTPSIRNMMNLNDLSVGENWSNSVYFPLLLKWGGWSVYHYDNQTITQTSDTGIARMFYADINTYITYDAVSDSIFAHDGEYVDYVERKLKPREKKGKRFVIYHLTGQHFPASERYTGPGRFSADDITVDRPWLNNERRNAIAQYDSAMAYNDSIVGAIIDQRNDNLPTILFYFSDHGEDCWDMAPLEARNKQMPSDKAWLDRQFHIPFMVWMSDSFFEQYPEIAKRINEASQRKGMLDNFGQLVLGISGINTPYYRPTRDISNPRYTPRPLVTVSGYHLD